MEYNFNVKHDTSMIEIAYLILQEYNKHKTITKEHITTESKARKTKAKKVEHRAIPEGIYFQDLFNEIARLKQFDESVIDDMRAHLYTDLTLSSKFLMTSDNYWDLSVNHYSADRLNVSYNSYNDEYDEESIRAAKEKWIEIQKAKGEEVTEIDMQYIMDNIDDLLSEEDVIEPVAEETIEE